MMSGCELHGRTQEQTLASWRHPQTIHALETGDPALVYCACCDGPALASNMAVSDELGNDLPGGASAQVTCIHCLVETIEQATSIIRRLQKGLPVGAKGIE